MKTAESKTSINEVLNWNNTTRRGIINFRPCIFDCWQKSIPIFRSGSLDYATPEQINMLSNDFKITKWFCLSTVKELKQSNLISNKIDTCFFSLQEQEAFRQLKFPKCDDYVDLYWYYLSNCIKVLNEFFCALGTTNANDKILISCYAGKDRTGLLCMLLSGLLLKDNRYIIDDYSLSSDYLCQQIDFFETHWQKRQLTKDEYIERFKNLETIISSLLNKITREYGGVEEYLLKIGVSKDCIYKIRSNFLPYLNLRD